MTDREGVRAWAVVDEAGNVQMYENGGGSGACHAWAQAWNASHPHRKPFRVVALVEAAAPAAPGATPPEMNKRITDDRLASMAAVCELKRQPGHEPNNITYRGEDARNLVLDLRDARAACAPGAADAREALMEEVREAFAVFALMASAWNGKDENTVVAKVGVQEIRVCSFRRALEFFEKHVDDRPAARQPEADATPAPCPWCGGSPIIRMRNEEGATSGRWFANCSPVGCRAWLGGDDISKEQAIAEWNRVAGRERERAALLLECREAFEKLSHDPGLEEHHDSGHVGTCSAIPCVMLRALDAHLGSGK